MSIARDRNHPKIQHYVPQFILRKFAYTKHQIYVFDKSKKICFSSNVKRVAAQSKFYDFTLDNSDYSIESYLSKVEDKVAPIVESICSNRSLAVLTSDERHELASFFALQMVRTPQYRLRWEQIGEILKNWIFDNTNDSDKDISEIQEVINDSQIAQIRAVHDHKLLSVSFENKAWILFKTTSHKPFWISDNPIAMQNIRPKPQLGSNLGLNVDGVEIYFPLSKTLCLAMMCQSNYEMYEKLLAVKEQDQEAAKQLEVDWNEIETTFRSFQNGNATNLRPEVVENINSLQVQWATRFLFSSDNQFSLASEMISDNPNFANPPSIVTG